MMDRRALNVDRLRKEEFDVLIVGGGINGAGIARDLMMRGAGLRVALAEKNHFASGTSGKNSQLIHGGLRYLKYGEVHLVQEALRERSTLLRIAPELVQRLQFLIPCYSATDRWLYGAGLMLYDLLAGSHGIGHHTPVTPVAAEALEPGLAREGLRAGLLFFDCRVNSARLVLENVLDADARGAAVANYVEIHTNGSVSEGRDTLTGERFPIRARRIVDATGAWSHGAPLRLVRGSHLIFPRIHQGPHAIAHFDPAGRIVFLIPWGEAGDLTLVGTTDVDHAGRPDEVHISEEETTYLTGIVRRLFPEYKESAVASYSSLRPLVAESGRSATETSREHRIWETADGILHVSGGKYTTYREMSEEVVDALLRDVKPGRAYQCRTADVPLAIPSLPKQRGERIRMAVEREYARRVADLLYVSTYWGHERTLTPEWLAPVEREFTDCLSELVTQPS